MSQQEVIIFGAGRIGRGFVANLFHTAGYVLVLVDQSAELVSALMDAEHYTVVEAEDELHRHDDIIGGYDAIATSDTKTIHNALVTADIAVVAVFPQHFQDVTRLIAGGLLRRRVERPEASLDILLCANLPHAAAHFREHLFSALPAEAHAYATSRPALWRRWSCVWSLTPLLTCINATRCYFGPTASPQFPVDRNGFRGRRKLPGLRLVADIRPRKRESSTPTTCASRMAYLGALRLTP